MRKLKTDELLALKSINPDTPYFMSWDIETSKVTPQNGDKIQVPFLSNLLCINAETGEKIFSVFHRTLKQFTEFITRLTYIYDEEITIYAHNLDYELSFLLRETQSSGLLKMGFDDYGLQESSCILRDKNAPLSIVLEDFPTIKFKDSYALFNKSIKELGKDLIKRGYNFPKLDYDYDKLRLPWDKLSEHDYLYNQRDNEIVCYSLYLYAKDNKLDYNKIPLTFTSATKLNRYNFIKENFNGVKSLCIDNIDTYKSYDFYDMTLKAYQGGLTTAHYNYFNVLVPKVWSADIKSSYPNQMCSRKYPIYLKDTTSYFNNDDANDYYHDFLHLKTHKELERDACGVKGYYANVTLYDVEIKNDNYLLPISAAFCLGLEGERTVINGKVKKAKVVHLMCNNITLEWINKCYNYSNIDVYELYTTTKSRYLRLEEISFILNAFNIKENIDKEKYPLEYALAKIIINACYGIKVQKPIKDRYTIIQGLIHTIDFNTLDDACVQEEMQSIGLNVTKESVYNQYIHKMDNHKNKYDNKNFDIFTDGGYITEYARLQLLEMMIELVDNGFICIYADTDSLKFTTNGDISDLKSDVSDLYEYTNLSPHNDYTKEDLKVIEILGEFNKKHIENNKNNIRFMEYKEMFNIKDEHYDKICRLGIWEIESTYKLNNKEFIRPYKYFKTLGAKKYAYIGTTIGDNGEFRDYISTTIAGCSKGVNKYIELYANNIDLNKKKLRCSYSEALDEIINTGTLFDESASGRTVAIRETREKEECKKLLYNNRALNSAGGIIIEDTTYLLNISESDCQVLGDNYKKYKSAKRILNNKGELINGEQS